MKEYLEVKTTFDTKEEALKMASLLVGEKLGACAHISGPITSTYLWKGQIEEDQEWLFTIKTRRDLYSALEEKLKATHSYETPQIVATPFVKGSQDYFDWIDEETL